MPTLNRAQVVGLYGIMMNVSLEAEVALDWPNNSYGDLPIKVTASDGTDAQWKLAKAGGAELVKGSVLPHIPLDDKPDNDDTIVGYEQGRPVRMDPRD